MHLPPFEVFPVLQSQRIRMRQLVESDTPRMLEICYFNNVQAKDLQEAIEIVGKIEQRYLDGSSVHWIIEDIALGEIVGSCGFYRGFANDSAEIGYIAKEKFRRSGYVSEAVQLAVDFAFNQMQVKKVFANTDQTNIASQGVLHKAGFVKAAETENGRLQFHIVR